MHFFYRVMMKRLYKSVVKIPEEKRTAEVKAMIFAAQIFAAPLVLCRHDDFSSCRKKTVRVLDFVFLFSLFRGRSPPFHAGSGCSRLRCRSIAFVPLCSTTATASPSCASLTQRHLPSHKNTYAENQFSTFRNDFSFAVLKSETFRVTRTIPLAMAVAAI